MKKTFCSTLTLVVVFLAACASNPTNPETTMTISNKNKAIALLNSIETGDQTAIEYVNAENYTQHNLAVGDGLAGFGAVLQALPKAARR